MAKFAENLKQSFKQIRDSRAEAITEDTELEYRRNIEDRIRRIKGYDRTAENLLLDLCPSSTMTTQVAPSDFKAAEFMERDIKIGLDKRNDLIALEIVVNRYEELFGPYDQASKIKELLPSWVSKVSE